MNIKWYSIIVFMLIILGIAVALHPTRLRTGKLLIESGRVKEAIGTLMNIYRDDPDNYRAIQALAPALEQVGDIDMLKGLYNKLVDLKPKDDSFRELIRFSQWNNDPEGVRRGYDKWFEFRRKNGNRFDDDDGRDIIENLYFLCIQSKDYAKAVELADYKKKLDPSISQIIDNDKIELYEKAGDLKGVIDHLEQMLKNDGSNEYALDKYLQLAPAANKQSEARSYLAGMVKKNPRDSKLRLKLIDFDTRAMDYDSAKSEYLDWIAVSQNDIPVIEGYLEWLLSVEKQDLAIEYIEKLNPQLRTQNMKNTLVQLYEWNGMRDKLVGPYLERWRSNPSNSRETKDLVWMLIDLNRFDDVETVLKKMHGLYPNDVDYAQMLSNLYQQRKKIDESISTLEPAAKKKEDPKLLKQLGELYLLRATQ